jgi:hypothetical protein
MQSLRSALKDNGLHVARAEVLSGLIPIGFVAADFES